MKLIDKDAVVAKIEKWIELLTNEKNQKGASQIAKLSLGGRVAGLQEVKAFIDTLEVKEVDLEKEIDSTYRNYVALLGRQKIATVAKYFFELGRKVQKENRIMKQENKELELIKITIPTSAAYPIDEYVTTFADIVGNMTTLYAKKNHDYGNSFDEGCDKLGVSYPLGRMLDKMNRLITCMGKKETMQVNETIEDTLTDLACYSVMTLSYLKRKKNGNS